MRLFCWYFSPEIFVFWTKNVLCGSIDRMTAVVRVMSWCRIGDRTLEKAMINDSADAHMYLFFDEMKFLINSKTSTAALLKFGFAEVISSCTFYNRCNYLSILGSKLNHGSKRGPVGQKVSGDDIVTDDFESSHTIRYPALMRIQMLKLRANICTRFLTNRLS